MRLAVCLKQVPDTAAALTARPGALAPHAPGVDPVINPYDEFALEAALRLGDELGAAGVEVVLVTLAAEPAEDTVFHGLAMGAHRAVLLEAPAGAALDAAGAADCLAGELARLAPDLVLCGERAVDDDAAQVGPAIAERLGWPQISAAETVALAAGGRGVRARCRQGDTVAVIESSLPCVVSCVRGPALPRYASLDAIFAASAKPVERRRAAPAAGRVRRVALLPAEDARRGEVHGAADPAAAVSWLVERVAPHLPPR